MPAGWTFYERSGIVKFPRGKFHPTDLIAVLNDLGWTGKELAARLGVTPNAVSMWQTGKRPVPGYAVAYLDVVWRLRDLVVGAFHYLQRGGAS